MKGSKGEIMGGREMTRREEEVMCREREVMGRGWEGRGVTRSKPGSCVVTLQKQQG